MDSRVRTKSYGKRILASLPGFPVTESLDDALNFAAALDAGKETDSCAEG
ncbi:MAG: hypothetical protein M5R36_28030 [Deltaproteobacteria bacterium]|nr:hypothetical protein [Deltaproteobacteria bacterium]